MSHPLLDGLDALVGQPLRERLVARVRAVEASVVAVMRAGVESLVSALPGGPSAPAPRSPLRRVPAPAPRSHDVVPAAGPAAPAARAGAAPGTPAAGAAAAPPAIVDPLAALGRAPVAAGGPAPVAGRGALAALRRTSAAAADGPPETPEWAAPARPGVPPSRPQARRPVPQLAPPPLDPDDADIPW